DRARSGRPPPWPARCGRCAEGRRRRRESRSLEFEHLVADLDLVALLCACCFQGPLQLLLLGGPARDSITAVGAQDAIAAARGGFRTVDEEVRQRLGLLRRGLRCGRAQLEQGPPELPDPGAGC